MTEIDDNLLLCTSTELSERVKAYNAITRKLSCQLQSITWGGNISKENVKKIICNVKQDLLCRETNIAFETIGFLGCFLDNERLMDCLSVEEEQETFDNLVNLLQTCDDNKILNRALWSFAQSKFGCDIYSKNISSILDVIRFIMIGEQPSVTRYEALQVIKSLLESSPNDMREKMEIWFALVFKNFFHETDRVRGVAYSCMLICKNMKQNDNLDALYIQLIPFLPDLKDTYCKSMSMLIDEDCVYILKIWRLIVTILGKHLHPGTALINGLLEVVEKAFKSSRPECRVEAFKCWQVLITNFALDVKVINHPKRMKLLSAPFKSSNAKTEEIANAKLSAWWHFVVSLGEHCSDNFDTVVVPLLKFCFHTTGNMSGFDRSYVMSGASSPARKFPGLQVKSIELLATILNNGNKQEHQNFSSSMPELRRKIMTPTIFLKNFQLLFICVGDALQILNTENSTQLNLGLMILNEVALHVNQIILNDHHKRECVEMVKNLLYTSVALEKANDTPNSFLLEFMKIFTIGKLALPSSVMNSRSYNIPVGSKPQELVSGTLNNFFINKLLMPSLLIHKYNESYEKLWDEMLKKSNPACGKLTFFESTLEQLNNAAPRLCSDSVDKFVDLWTSTGSHLHDYIQQENTIDQGDGSDYDWRCMYKYFLFPVRHSHDHLTKIENSPIFQKVIATLKKLWNTFTSHCSLTPTAEPNCECDFVAKEMMSLLSEKFTGPPDVIAFTLTIMAELLYIMVEKFRFKDVGKKSIKALQSPARARKKPHILHNLGNCVDLLCIIMEKATRMIGTSKGNIMAKVALTATIVCKNIPKKYAWHFISSFCEVLRKGILINPSAKYTSDVEAIFMEMWNEYANCLQSHIGKNISADQMSKMSHLLITGLTNSHVGIKQKTKDLWYNNFASTKVPIPTHLYETLKCAALPPASISDALTESQEGFYKSPGTSAKVPSNESSPVTPVQKTPKCRLSPKKTTPRSSRKSIFEMKDEDFVTVSSPSVNKRILTTHQAEKMRSRGNDIPALYSDLSQSMSQLPAGFTTQESIDQSSTENKLRSKELFPPLEKIEKSTKKKEENLPSEISPSVDKKKDAPMKCYSEEDLNEILKDTSLELEKSLTETEKISSPYNHKKAEEKEYQLERKRKRDTPTKKSIEDVRKSLKGTKFTEKSEISVKLRKLEEDPSTRESVAGTRSQSLKNVDKSRKSVHLSAQNSNKEVVLDSDSEEIPCSQLEEISASKSILSTKGLDSPVSRDRPRRNKRKCLDDGYIYTTPTKRQKITPKKEIDSSIKTREDNMPHTKPTETTTPNRKCRDAATPNKNSRGIKTSSAKPTETNSPSTKAIDINTTKATEATTSMAKPTKLATPSKKLRDFKTSSIKPAETSTPNPNSTELNDNTQSIEQSTVEAKSIVQNTPEIKSTHSPTSNTETCFESSTVAAGVTRPKGRRGRGRGVNITEVQKLKHDNFDFEPKLLGSPTKVTRSGRRIVAPKKEIAEQITPSKKTQEKKQSPQYSSSISKMSPKIEDKKWSSQISQSLTKISPKVDEKKWSPQKSQSLTKMSPKMDEKKWSPQKRLSFTKMSPEIEEKDDSLQKFPSSTDISPKALCSPLASPIKSPVRVSPKAISILKVSSEKTEPKGDSGNVKLNRKLFDDSPNKEIVSSVSKSDNLITHKLSKSPSKSPSSNKQSLEKLLSTKTVDNLMESDSPQEYNEPHERKPLIDRIQSLVDAKSGEANTNIGIKLKKLENHLSDDKQESPNLRKRKCSDIDKHDSTKVQKINNEHNSVKESQEVHCESEDNNSLEVNVGDDIPAIYLNKVPVDNQKINSKEVDNVKNKDKSLPNSHQSTEDENMNMVKESIENKDVGNVSVDNAGPTSFTGLINKQTTSPKADADAGNLSKTATVTWSPSRRSASKSPQSKEDNNAKLPFIFVRNYNSNNEASPVLKAQMLVLGQNSSTDKVTSAVKKASPPSKQASHINMARDTPPSVGESEGKPRRQESPLRRSHSKLSSSISTPEVHQLRKQKIQHRSRAAAMLACAQQTMKIKASDLPEYTSPGRFSRGSRPLSNGNSPRVGRKSGELAAGGAPWVRFEPSPNASPSSGILKRKEEDHGVRAYIDSPGDNNVKNRRVSFADPVFESIEIPPSPKVLRFLRAQKKLDLTKSCDRQSAINEAMSLKEANKELNNDRILDSSKPIYPDLSRCHTSVGELISELAVPGKENDLTNVLKTSSVTTIGDIALLTESELHCFPVLSPKTERTMEILKNFATSHGTKKDMKPTEVTHANGIPIPSKDLKNSDSSLHITDNTIGDATDEELLQEMYSRLEKNSTLVKRHCETVPHSMREELFQCLLSYMPPARVVDIYSDFVKKKLNL